MSLKTDRDPRPYHQVYESASEFIGELRSEKGTVTGILGDGSITNRALSACLTGDISRDDLREAIEFEKDIVRIIFSEFGEHQKIDFVSNVGGDIKYGVPVSITADEAAELYGTHLKKYVEYFINRRKK